MACIQVYLTGLSESTSPDDEELEGLIVARYNLSADDITWAGPGTTLIKRNGRTQVCRGYGFLSFLSSDGASIAVDKINAFRGDENDTTAIHNQSTDTSLPSNSVTNDDCGHDNVLPLQLRAELSKPKANTKKAQQKKSIPEKQGDDSDIRLRRQRKTAVRKHPVIISSDKKKTGLGNKTK
jgi:hypothetical protein